MKKQKSFASGEIYTTLSNIKRYKLFYKDEYKRSKNTDVLNKYERLKDCLFLTIDKNAAPNETLTIFLLNVRSLAKYINDIVHDYRYLRNDVIGITKTQMKLSDPTTIVDVILKYFNMNVNNDDKFLNLSCRCQNDTEIIRKFDISVIFIISLKRDSFTDRVFK